MKVRWSPLLVTKNVCFRAIHREHHKTVSWPDDPIYALLAIGRPWPSHHKISGYFYEKLWPLPFPWIFIKSELMLLLTKCSPIMIVLLWIYFDLSGGSFFVTHIQKNVIFAKWPFFVCLLFYISSSSPQVRWANNKQPKPGQGKETAGTEKGTKSNSYTWYYQESF